MIILWKVDLFERYIIENFRIKKQHLFMGLEDGELTWRTVPWKK
jgi:hypothetical protein